MPSTHMPIGRASAGHLPRLATGNGLASSIPVLGKYRHPSGVAVSPVNGFLGRLGKPAGISPPAACGGGGEPGGPASPPTSIFPVPPATPDAVGAGGGNAAMPPGGPEGG